MTRNHSKIARLVGSLFILGLIVGLLSVVPAVEDPDYLVEVTAHENQVINGALFQFLMVAAYVGVAITLYPLLRHYQEGLALGFLGFRLIAGMFNMLGVIIVLLILPLSQEFVNAGAPDSSHFQTLGHILRTGRDLTNHVAMILASSLASLMLYSLLYRTNLVPRWLSGWGLVGTALAIFASLLVMFRVVEVVSTTYLAMNFPIALQEIVLALWLIIKGFNSSAIAIETN